VHDLRGMVEQMRQRAHDAEARARAAEGSLARLRAQRGAAAEAFGRPTEARRGDGAVAAGDGQDVAVDVGAAGEAEPAGPTALTSPTATHTHTGLAANAASEPSLTPSLSAGAAGVSSGGAAAAGIASRGWVQRRPRLAGPPTGGASSGAVLGISSAASAPGGRGSALPVAGASNAPDARQRSASVQSAADSWAVPASGPSGQ